MDDILGLAQTRWKLRRVVKAVNEVLSSLRLEKHFAHRPRRNSMQVIGGYSGAEMAEMLELPRATVNTRLFRARQQLRKQLESGAGTSAAREERRS